MKVGRGGLPKKPAQPAQDATPVVGDDAPQLRVGVPGRTYKPEAKPLGDRGVDQRKRANADVDNPVVLEGYDGWTDAVASRANCKYGCGGGDTRVPGIMVHRYDCPYWQREGKDESPF